MSLVLRPVEDRATHAAFLRLPHELHRGEPRWVPPLLRDEARAFDPARNLAHRYCEVDRVLAVRNGRVVGRVAAVLNRRYNEARGEASGRWGWLEAPDDPEVVLALLSWAEDWARARGLHRIRGPLGLTDQDPEGLLVEGFQHEPAVASASNPPFLPRLVAQAGYDKDTDYVVYRVPLDRPLPVLYERIHARVLDQRRYHLGAFRSRRELLPWVRPILALMNQNFADLFGYSVLDEDELDDLARQWLPVIDPRFVKTAREADGSLVGFVLGMPNMAPGLRRARGRLFPLGALHLLRAARRSRQLDLLLGAVAPAHRRRGVDVLMGRAMLEEARVAGFTFLDSHHELEDNRAVHREMEIVGGRLYKRYRVYGRALAGRRGEASGLARLPKPGSSRASAAR